jgi:hypothetical protein
MKNTALKSIFAKVFVFASCFLFVACGTTANVSKSDSV